MNAGVLVLSLVVGATSAPSLPAAPPAAQPVTRIPARGEVPFDSCYTSLACVGATHGVSLLATVATAGVFALLLVPVGPVAVAAGTLAVAYLGLTLVLPLTLLADGPAWISGLFVHRAIQRASIWLAARGDAPSASYVEPVPASAQRF